MLAALSVFGTNLMAQEREFVLRGIVFDDDGPLPGVVIFYMYNGNEGTEFAVSDNEGNFALKLHGRPTAADSVKVSMLGYATRIIPADMADIMHIKMEIEPIRLNEVIVRAPKVKLAGDTVRFNVNSFAEIQDKSVSDVLKRMPGIEVRKDGSIYYNGELIDNLYVEGTDILGGRYSLLTENLSAKDVRSIEVMTRHQPIRALAEIGTKTRPAINLRLSERSKGKWISNARLACGLTSAPEILWDANLFFMRVGLKWNSLNNIKTNNTGEDLSRELQVKSYNNRSMGTRPEGFISVGTSNAPLDEQRVRFNTSLLFNTSNMFNLKNDWKITSSFSYLFDRLESRNESSTTYYFNDGIQTVNEGENTMTRKHLLRANIDAEANKKDYYFLNTMTVEGEFAHATQMINGEFANTQQASLPYFMVNDDLKYIKRTGDKAFTVESHNDYSFINQKLTVLRAGDDIQRQSVRVMDYNNNTFFSSDFIVMDGMSIGVSAGFEASIRSLESLLNGVGAAYDADLLYNNHIVAYIRPYVRPNMEFRSKNWEIRLAVPVGWSKYWGVDAGHFTYKASGSVKYTPWPKLSFEILGTASAIGLDIHDMYSGYIMRNYRYLKAGSANDEQDHYYSVTGHINFKDPVNMLFIDGIVGKYWNVFQTSATQDFLGDYIILGTEYAPSIGESLYASIGGSVGIYGINGKFGVTVSYRDYSSTSILQNGVRTPYLSQTVSFMPVFSGRFADWISMEYKLLYSHNILSLPERGTHDSKDNFSHTLSFNISPINNLDLKISAEHYFTMFTSEQTKNAVLFDASLAYRFNNGLEISITARNLLNQQTYAYSVYSGLEEFSCEYRIRPLNILIGAFFNF